MDTKGALNDADLSKSLIWVTDPMSQLSKARSVFGNSDHSGEPHRSENHHLFPLVCVASIARVRARGYVVDFSKQKAGQKQPEHTTMLRNVPARLLSCFVG
jgi:hypothetical protein